MVNLLVGLAIPGPKCSMVSTFLMLFFTKDLIFVIQLISLESVD